MPFSEQLLRRLPKTDLHVHLDGSLRIETLIELARERGVELPSTEPDGLRELVFKEQYRDLAEYLQGFAYTCAVLHDAEALERAAYELARGLPGRGRPLRRGALRAAAPRAARASTWRAVLAAVDRGLERVRREHAQSDAVAHARRAAVQLRHHLLRDAACSAAGFSPYYRSLFDVLDRFPATEVFGIGVAGAGARGGRGARAARAPGGRASTSPAPRPATRRRTTSRPTSSRHHHFLKKTVHAGEAYGPESIFQAITKLHADRIGHGTHLYSADLVQTERGSASATCASSSSTSPTGGSRSRSASPRTCRPCPSSARVEDHPFGRMMRDRLSVTLCTDNRLVSQHHGDRRSWRARARRSTSARRQLRNVIIYGFKRSFFPGTYREKRAYVRQVIDYYDRVVAAETPESIGRERAAGQPAIKVSA